MYKTLKIYITILCDLKMCSSRQISCPNCQTPSSSTVLECIKLHDINHRRPYPHVHSHQSLKFIFNNCVLSLFFIYFF